jgi:hypothetical protein
LRAPARHSQVQRREPGNAEFNITAFRRAARLPEAQLQRCKDWQYPTRPASTLCTWPALAQSWKAESVRIAQAGICRSCWCKCSPAVCPCVLIH